MGLRRGGNVHGYSFVPLHTTIFNDSGVRLPNFLAKDHGNIVLSWFLGENVTGGIF